MFHGASGLPPKSGQSVASSPFSEHMCSASSVEIHPGSSPKSQIVQEVLRILLFQEYRVFRSKREVCIARRLLDFNRKIPYCWAECKVFTSKSYRPDITRRSFNPFFVFQTFTMSKKYAVRFPTQLPPKDRCQRHEPTPHAILKSNALVFFFFLLFF